MLIEGFILVSICAFMCESAYKFMHMDMNVLGSKKIISAPPELELQVIVSRPIWWVLGTEPMSYEVQR